MEREEKLMIGRVAVTAAMLCAALLCNFSQPALIAIYVIAYIVAGVDVVVKSLRGIIHGEVFDENFLMMIATAGAFAIGEYPEAVAVMLFYQIGELFSDMAVERSRASISSLMDIRPDYANVEVDGKLQRVSPDDVEVGSTIVVKPGEKIPLDGIVTSGESMLDTAALTGESAPRDVAEGSQVISGCLNMTGLLHVRTTSNYGQSTVAKILELVENADEGKSQSERFITRFARYYTPIVVVAAVLLAVVPPVMCGGMWSTWLYRALIFLVISCPCALVVSVPLSFFAGIGGASRRGILVKGSNYLELLGKVRSVAFDKTGTLTRGSFSVVAVHPEVITEKELVEYAALIEMFSDHPVAVSLRSAYERNLDAGRVSDVKNYAGEGVYALIDGVHKIYAGNEKLMNRIGVGFKRCEKHGTIVHVAVDGEYVGHIVVSDSVKPESADAVAGLKKLGVERVVMLTGDHSEVAQEVASQLGLDGFDAELLPADKVAKVEQLRSDATMRPLAFVGDGINDAPVLKLADIGIAMGAAGSDAAIEAADVVLMNDNPKSVVQGIAIARRTMRIVHQNIVFAIGIKVAMLLLGACGFTNMWAAVFADVGVTVIAVLNALRAMR